MNAQAAETHHYSSKNDREIADAKVIVTCPGRNVVALKIAIRSGVSGLEDGSMWDW